MENIINKEILKFLNITDELKTAIKNKNVDVILSIISKQYYLDLEFIKTITLDLTNKNTLEYFLPKSYKKELAEVKREKKETVVKEYIEKYIYILFNDNVNIKVKENILDSFLDMYNLGDSTFKKQFNEKMLTTLNEKIKFKNYKYNKKTYPLYNYVLETFGSFSMLNKTEETYEKINDELVTDNIIYEILDFFEENKNNTAFIRKITEKLLSKVCKIIIDQKSFERYMIVLEEFVKNDITKKTPYGEMSVFNYKDYMSLLSQTLENALNKNIKLKLSDTLLNMYFPDKTEYKKYVETTYFYKEEKIDYSRKEVIKDDKMKMFLAIKTLSKYKNFYETSNGKIFKKTYMKTIKTLFENEFILKRNVKCVKIKVKSNQNISKNENEVITYSEIFNEKELNEINETILKFSPKGKLNPKYNHSEEEILYITSLINESIVIRYVKQTQIENNLKLYDYFIEKYFKENKKVEINENLLLNFLKINYIISELELTTKTKEELDREKEFILSNMSKELLSYLKINAFKDYKYNKTIKAKELFIDFLNIRKDVKEFFNKDIYEESNKKLFVISQISHNLLDVYEIFLEESTDIEIIEYFFKNIEMKIFKQKLKNEYIDLDKEMLNQVYLKLVMFLIGKKSKLENIMLVINKINQRKILESLILQIEDNDVLSLMLNITNENYNIEDKKILIDLINIKMKKNIEKNPLLITKKVVEEQQVNNEEDMKALLEILNSQL